MKSLLLFALIAGASFGQTTVFTVTAITMPTAAFNDLQVVMNATFSDPVTPITLGAAQGVADTTITVSSTVGIPAGGGAILVDAEVEKYTGISGNTLTGVTRGQHATAAVAHVVATPAQTVHLLTYAGMPDFCKGLLAQQVQHIISSMGQQSAYLTSLQATAAAANAAVAALLAAAVQ